MIRCDRCGFAVLVLACWVSAAAAQSRSQLAASKRFTLSAGLITSGGYSIGARDADLRSNSLSPGSAPFVLFHADATLERASGIDARIGYALGRLLTLEVGGTYTKPQLSVTVSRDAEAATTVATEDVSQYTVDVSGVIRLPGRFLRAKASAYALGGGGYLRQLHDDRVLVETGQIIFGGGGVQIWFRGSGGRGHPSGIRAEARYLRRIDGIDFEEKSRGYPVISVLGFVGF